MDFKSLARVFSLRCQQYMKKLGPSVLPENMQEFSDFFTGGITSLMQLYPKEFKALLDEKKIPEHFYQIHQSLKDIQDKIIAYKINGSKACLEVTLANKLLESWPLRDMNDFLQTDWSIKKDDEFYIPLLAYLSLPENFELIQLYKAYF